MGLDTLTPPKISNIERREQRLREQLNEGFRLARELDERIRSIPVGGLSAGNEPTDAAGSSSALIHLRCSIAAAVADVAAAFTESIKLLLHPDSLSDQSPSARSAVSASFQPAFHALPQHEAAKPCAPSVFGQGEASHSAVEQAKSPPHSTAGCRPLRAAPAATDQSKQQSIRACASAASSPPFNVMHSPSILSATPSDMSDGSPKPLDLAAPDEATTTSPVKTAICRKRKAHPKMTLKMPAGSAEAAENNTPPDDGHTWRKYGQKNILGAQYPRSYYRCTHKTDTGCPAIKQVQRCDEDDSFFDVVYKGYHECRSAELDKECWPLAFPQGLSSMLRFPATRTATLLPSSAGASFMLANMGAATQSTVSACTFDSLLRHADASGAGNSDALPLTYSMPEGRLSVSTQAHTPTSAPKLGPERRSFATMNVPALQQSQFNSGQALLSVINDPAHASVDHLPTLLTRNASPTVQDENVVKDELREALAVGGGGGPHAVASRFYAQLSPLGGVADARVEDWAEFESSTAELRSRRQLACSPVSYGASAACSAHLLHSQLPTTLSIPKNDDTPLAFDGMDNDDDLLGYLDP